ncbi:MAG: amidohydrolase, partial [Sphingobacteriaceae bacterium]|nr:amidohydrolase [Sphingobacteriaceae bacterium]
MMTYISANFIYPITSAPIKNGVLGLDEEGTINAILTAEEAMHIKDIIPYKGVIVPGFINTHCHLELSHLKNKIEEKTGLTGFIK